MSVNIRLALAVVLAALALGLWAGKTYFPVTKTEQVEKEVVRKDIVTVTKEVVRPDGTRETETTVVDKTKEQKDSRSTVSVATSKPDWHVSASISRESLIGPNIYAVTVERRVLGPFSIGLTANTQQTIGLVVGMEF